MATERNIYDFGLCWFENKFPQGISAAKARTNARRTFIFKPDELIVLKKIDGISYDIDKNVYEMQ